jgi:methyl-accepting chemotaxis protein
MESKNRRKIFLINPKLQYNFIGFSLLMSLISIAIFYLATIYLFWRFEQTGYNVGIPEGHIFFRFIKDQRSMMDIILLVAAPIISIVCCYINIKLSHRVAGPIYRMIEHLKVINASNELNEVKFRENDYFMELQDEFNKFIKTVEKK